MRLKKIVALLFVAGTALFCGCGNSPDSARGTELLAESKGAEIDGTGEVEAGGTGGAETDGTGGAETDGTGGADGDDRTTASEFADLTKEETTDGPGTDSQKMERLDAASWDFQDQDLPGSDVERRESVGIRAHIKEIKGDQALISSDTDEFPGVFLIIGLLNLTGQDGPDGDGGFKGGTEVFLVMADSGQKTGDGIPVYRAWEIFPAPEDEEGQARADVLLTEPPALRLQDVLSSVLDPFEVRPGNYSWNVDMGDGTMTSTIACGSAPLDEAGLRAAARLTVKDYNKMDQVMYACSTVFFPDKLVVRQWDNGDVTDGDAREERVTTYYCQIPLLGLEKGKVYEFSAWWNQENLDKNGFWGDAAYVFVTE